MENSLELPPKFQDLAERSQDKIAAARDCSAQTKVMIAHSRSHIRNVRQTMRPPESGESAAK